MINVVNALERVLGDEREVCGITHTATFTNFFDLLESGRTAFLHKRNDVLMDRKENELHFHNFLEHQLFSRLQEIKYYSKVNIGDTRRLVAVSSDCISMVQILVRSNTIHLMVHFRSSDFDGALPVDLEWVSSLPYKLIRHLSKMQNCKGYEEVTKSVLFDINHSEVKLSLSFGSLHRTN